ncbi:hypothetical protein Y032_0101g3329 [Ancylostoma ceylanicum]|uniref:ENTH domain-containing protein n=1 Tax=Ancylostoma ceylanicum TaxID=53326 RepID=A0A016THL4_9BILA|nr:hypothetical protein Y032_0101g3329 [Ancylostoma ceylanicum]
MSACLCTLTRWRPSLKVSVQAYFSVLQIFHFLTLLVKLIAIVQSAWHAPTPNLRTRRSRFRRATSPHSPVQHFSFNVPVSTRSLVLGAAGSHLLRTMSELLSGISNLTKQISNNIPYQIKKLGESVHTMVMNYTEAENLVYEATNEDPWGPTGPQMKEIANYTFQYEGFHQVMNLLWKRMLEDNKTAWRRVYKSLTLLNHLLFHGSERVIGNARDHTFQMRVLEHYKYVDDRGRDQGLNVADFASIRKGGARGQTPRSELNLSGLNFCFTSCHAPILQRWL